MWLTSVDIASTPGGQAGMQRSQPLQCAACLMVCPDFCFEVFRFNTPIETEVQTEEMAS